MTDEEIKNFRAELLKDAWARGTDMPCACARALKTARGRLQKLARERARLVVLQAYRIWQDSGRDGIRSTEATLGFSLR